MPLIRIAPPALTRLIDRYRAEPGRAVIRPYVPERSLIGRHLAVMLLVAAALVGAIGFGVGTVWMGQDLLLYLASPLIVGALLIVWMLPDGGRAPTGTLNGLYWAFLVSLIMWPNYLALALPGLPWITVQRLINFPMALVLLICLSVSASFRQSLREAFAVAPFVWKAMVVLVAIQLFGTFVSPSPFIGPGAFFKKQMLWTMMLVVSVWIFQRPGTIPRWATIVIVMAASTTVIGLLEARVQHILWVDHIPSFLTIDDPIVANALRAVYRGGQYRAVSTFMISLSFAEYLALASGFLLHRIVVARRLWERAILIGLDVLIFAGIYVTHARLGTIGFIISHVLYLLFWAMAQARKRPGDLKASAALMAFPLFAVTLAATIMVVPRARVMVFGDGSQTASNEARKAQWAMTPAVLMRSPLTGFGPERGAGALGYTNLGGVQTVDSYFISILLDYGLLGFFCFYGIAVWGIVMAGRMTLTARDETEGHAIAIMVTLVAYLFIKVVLSQESNNSFLFILIGMMIALLRRRQLMDAADDEATAGRRALPAPAPGALRRPVPSVPQRR